MDEVVCAFGRTGKVFGFEHWGVRPDVVTMAKGLTSGYVPLGATVVSDEVWSTIADRLPEKMPLSHGFTYMGHPVSCAAALANLDIIEREHLADNAAEVGAHLLGRLHELESFESVGEVRGLGLMAGIELVAEKESRRGFSDPHTACELVEHEAWERGLYCRATATEVVGLAPPLVIDTETADQIVEILAESIEAMERQMMPPERARAAAPATNVPSVAEFFEDVLPDLAGALTSGGPDLAVQFSIDGEGGGSWTLEVRDGVAIVSASEGGRSEAAATIRASAPDFLRIVNGELSGVDAFMSQRLTVDGDLDAAAQLAKLGLM
jgi:hypothetical protein